MVGPSKYMVPSREMENPTSGTGWDGMWVAATPPHHTSSLLAPIPARPMPASPNPTPFRPSHNTTTNPHFLNSSVNPHRQPTTSSTSISSICCSPCLALPCRLAALFFQLQHTLFCQITQLLAMAGVAQSMIACSTSTGSWRTRALFTKPAGKSAQTRAPLRICAVKAPEDCNDEECAPVKEVSGTPRCTFGVEQELCVGEGGGDSACEMYNSGSK